MAQAQAEIPRLNPTRWTEQSNLFKANIAELNNEATTTAIDLELERFHSEWESGAPDFETFQTNCIHIFTAHLPQFQMPPMQLLLKKFMFTLFVAAIGILVAGLIMMLQAEFLALIGLITITTFHFKALAIIAGSIATVAATLVSLSLFKTSTQTNIHLNHFMSAVPEPAPAPTLAT